jgi:hypothetical protein
MDYSENMLVEYKALFREKANRSRIMEQQVPVSYRLRNER